MATVLMLLVALAAIYYVVAFYATLTRKALGWVIRLRERRAAVSGLRYGMERRDRQGSTRIL